MLNDGIIFAILSKGKNDIEIKLIDIDKEDFASISRILTENEWMVTQNAISFDGSYKPDIDESLVINDFNIENEIMEAINNPLGVDSLSIDDNEIDKIKAIFIAKDPSDNNLKILFQKFKKAQYLKHNFLKIFWDKNTVNTIKEPGLNITDCVDCCFDGGKLYFKSYYIANQILDLSAYYREATNDDLQAFATDSLIVVKDVEQLKSNANKWIRKKIASIIDSGVLDKHSGNEIKDFAHSVNIDVEVVDGKIIFPVEQKQQRELLKFLSDEIYRGCLSDEIYETNSKKINQAN